MAYFEQLGADVDCVLFQVRTKDKYMPAFREKYAFCSRIFEARFPAAHFKFGELLAAANRVANSEPVRSLLVNHYDMCYSNYVFTSPIAFALRNAPLKVLETVDHLWEAFARSGLSGNMAVGDASLLMKMEFELYTLFNKIVFVNNDEYRSTPPQAGISYSYIPPAVQCSVIAADAATDQPNDVLFIGSVHPPNIDGIHFFYNNVFVPFLRPKGITLTIAGKVCDCLRFDDGAVHKVGLVRGPLKDLYESSKVVIIPILEGTGVSIKTLEAMSFGKAIVTAPKGVRGMAIHGSPVINIDMKSHPEDFAEAICDLLQSPEKRWELGERALSYVKHEHSFEVYCQRMDRFLGVAREKHSDPI